MCSPGARADTDSWATATDMIGASRCRWSLNGLGPRRSCLWPAGSTTRSRYVQEWRHTHTCTHIFGGQVTALLRMTLARGACRVERIHTNTHIHATCTHTYTHSYKYKCMHAYMHTYIHAYIHAYIHTWIHSFIHSSIHSFIHSLVHSFIHPFIRSIQLDHSLH